MKVIYFIVLVIAVVLSVLDSFIFKSIKHVIQISGDGKYSMNNFEMTALLIKTLACVLGIGAAITLFRTRRVPLIKPVTCLSARKSWTASYPMESIS